MRRRIAGLLLAFVAVGVAGSASGQDAPPAAPAPPESAGPVATCPPAPGPITLDGDLREWNLGNPLVIGPDGLVRKGVGYAGAADLSGRIHVCRSATTLYVAGEVLDDTLNWNPDATVSYRGDGVELFFDFRRDPLPRANDAYDQDAYQLLLHPLAGEMRWQFAWFRGRAGRMDDAIDGLDLAGMRFQDDRGATVGYRFEVAIPLANFPGAPTASGQSLGFDVALSDADEVPNEQRNYATWSGRAELSRYPGRFGRLVLGDDPAPVAPAPTGSSPVLLPIAFLSVLLGLVLVVWLARGLDARESRIAEALVRIGRIPFRSKAGAAAVLLALLVAAGPVTDLVAAGLARNDLSTKREMAALLREVSEEAAAVGLQRPQPPAHPSPLLSLAAGQTVKPPTDYEFTVLPPLVLGADGVAVREPTSRTISGVPFFRRDIPATAAWSGSFLVHPPTSAEAATVVYSWQPDPGTDVPPKAGDVVAEIRFAHLDGTVDAPTRIVWGAHADARNDPAATPGGPHPGAPEAAIAFVGTEDSGTGPVPTHADEIRVDLGARDSPLVRIEVEQKAAGGRFTTHGVTLHPAGREPVPLPLGRTTRGGIPTAASPFPAPDAGLLLLRTAPRAVIPCDALADRMWLVVSLRRGFADSRLGMPVLTVRPEFDDGSADGPFPLENGVDVDAETSPARQHGARFRSEIAFEWGLPEDPSRRHADVWSVPLGRPGRRLARLHLEFKGEEEVVRVSSVVLGTPTAGRRPEKLLRLESTADGYRASPAVVERLSGVEFTAFRDGAAHATTLGGPDRDRTLGRTVADRTLAEVARTPEGVHEARLVEGRRIHSLSVPLPGARPGTFVEMTWTSTAEETFEEAVFRVRAVLGVLLAPIVVLLAADLVLRLRAVHQRLVAVSASVAAIPAVLGFFAVPGLVGGTIEGAERAAVLEKSAAVKARIAALPAAARKRAEAALGDEALREALARKGLDDFRAAVTAALRDIERNVAAETVPGARVVLDVVRLSGPAERHSFPKEVRFTIFRDRASQVTDTLAYRWSRLTARGVAPQFDTEGDWQTTLVVDLPVDRAALEGAAAAAGGDVRVSLFTPRGFPLATTGPLVPGDELPEEMQRKVALAQRVLAEQHPVVETRVLGGSLFTVAYDVLRGESGDVSLVATALPRTGADALLSRVGQTSLLVLGAGLVAQFLLLGLVAVSTSRPLRRVVERATGPATAPAPDDVAALDGAVAALQADRDVYRDEIARLAAAVAELSRAEDPEAVASGAVELVRTSVAPWGAVLVTVETDGRLDVAGGFRGAERLARMPVVVDAESPLQPVLRGRGSARVDALGAVADALSRDERRLFEGAATMDAFPLGAPEEPGGALVLLERPGGPGPPRRFHTEFLAALARQVGLALASARLVRLAVRDRETGASVASYFAERLREEVDRAVAAKRPIALVLVTATAPPSEPAEARAAAHRLADRLRAAAPGRAFLGRTEPFTFALAVPEADRGAAEAVLTQVRRAAAEPALADLRIRAGAAACPEDAGSSEFLQAEARRRLGADGAPEAPRPAVEPDAGDRLVAEARRLGAIFTSAEGRALLETVDRIAASQLTILLEGETGVGKEVIADLVHRKSPRRDRPLVKVNCAALPDALLESELFGYERGAFTGAERSKPGRFELADGGTLFLDEVGEMPLATQAKLLRVLEDRTVEHLGGTKPVSVDVRVIVATNRDLGRMVAEGRFREDLWYRLNGVTIAIPPLRARKEDLPVLAEAFLRSAAETHGRKPPTLQPDAMDLLWRHDWPGNVRELRNLMEQAVVLTPGETIRAADLLPALGKSPRRAGGEPSREPGRSPSAAGTAGAPGRPAALDSDSPAAVSDRQRRLLALMAERTWITTSEYCDVVGVSPRTALRDVRELVERGVIVMEGKRRGARYRLP